MAYPQDIVDATLQFLRGPICAGAFGDTFQPGPPPTGTMKFFADYAGEVPEPYLVISEPLESRTYFTRGSSGIPFLSDGQMILSIFASDRGQARDLGDLVAYTLTDAQFGWEGVPQIGTMRAMSSMFVAVPATGPGVPSVFCRVVPFVFQYQGSVQ